MYRQVLFNLKVNINTIIPFRIKRSQSIKESTLAIVIRGNDCI